MNIQKSDCLSVYIHKPIWLVSFLVLLGRWWSTTVIWGRLLSLMECHR